MNGTRCLAATVGHHHIGSCQRSRAAGSVVTNRGPLRRISEESNIQSLIQSKMKTIEVRKLSPALAKGQLWRTEECHIRIVGLETLWSTTRSLRICARCEGTQMSRT